MPDAVACENARLRNESPRRKRSVRNALWATLAFATLLLVDSAAAQEAPNRGLSLELPAGLSGGPRRRLHLVPSRMCDGV